MALGASKQASRWAGSEAVLQSVAATNVHDAKNNIPAIRKIMFIPLNASKNRLSTNHRPFSTAHQRPCPLSVPPGGPSIFGGFALATGSQEILYIHKMGKRGPTGNAALPRNPYSTDFRGQHLNWVCASDGPCRWFAPISSRLSTRPLPRRCNGAAQAYLATALCVERPRQRKEFSSSNRTPTLGREDSNLRMVESKSGHFTNVFNVHSEKSMEFSLKAINRLAANSE